MSAFRAPAEARRRRAADHRQRHELPEGRGRRRRPLLSFDDARTLFHEFGHGLHGLLSDVTYPMIAGTSVARDFVEFPSQLYEHWLEQPEVLGRFARHYRTGEPMPDALIDRLLSARAASTRASRPSSTRRRRWSTSSSTCCPRPTTSTSTPSSATRSTRARHAGRDRDAAPARRISGTSSRATAIRRPITAISGPRRSTPTGSRPSRRRATSSIRDTADRLRRFVYSAGDLREPGDAYRAFRGRLPKPEALMRQRGLVVMEGGDGM